MPEKETRNVFLPLKCLTIFICGILYALIIPPFEAPDEPAHFLRAYGIAEGQFILRDHPREVILFLLTAIKKNRGDLRIPVLEEIRGRLSQSEDRIPNIAYNSSQYSPLPYFLHAFVIRVMMCFRDSADFLRITFYLCRIMSVVLFTALMYFSFRMAPSLAWIVFWVVMTPMALSQASIISPDVIVLSASIFLIVTSVANPGILLFAFCILLSIVSLFLSKIPYVPLICIPLISTHLCKDRKKFHCVVFSLIMGIISSCIWAYYVQKNDIYGEMVNSIQVYINSDIKPDEQLTGLLETPAKIPQVVFSTIWRSGASLGYQFVGVLGWLDIPIPIFLVISWYLFLLLSIYISLPPSSLSVRNSQIIGWTCVISSFIVVASIIVSLYLIWAPVHADFVQIQGRYFHPVACAFLCGIVMLKKNKIKSISTLPFKSVLIGYSLFLQICTLATIKFKFP